MIIIKNLFKIFTFEIILNDLKKKFFYYNPNMSSRSSSQNIFKNSHKNNSIYNSISSVDSESESSGILNSNKQFLKEKNKKCQVDYFQNIKIHDSEFSGKNKTSLIKIIANTQSLKIYKNPLYKKFQKSADKDKIFKHQSSSTCTWEKNVEIKSKFKKDKNINDCVISEFDLESKSYITPPKIDQKFENSDFLTVFDVSIKSKKNEDKNCERIISSFQL